MQAIYASGEQTHEAECIKCFDCLESCEYGAIDFKLSAKNIKNVEKLNSKNKDKKDQQDMTLTRKNFLSACFGSLAVLPIFKFAGIKNRFTYIIRPPGALKEAKFLEKCIRCGQCMKACPTHGLHPSFLEGGISAIYTPRLIPRVGQCDYNCNLCSQVCPTRAIEPYNIQDKEKIIIGTAVIDQHLCFPWSENKNCLVCEEMCPVSTKAIKLKERTIVNEKGGKKRVLLPYVIMELCIGCGNCENKCPVEGSAAIRVRVQKIKIS
jgi:MauM/NapG family ferredoxin protein